MAEAQRRTFSIARLLLLAWLMTGLLPAHCSGQERLPVSGAATDAGPILSQPNCAVITGYVYHFSGSPWRGGATRTLRRLKANTQRRVGQDGNRLVFDIDGHFSVVDEYVEKITQSYRRGEFNFLCLTGYSWGACISDIADALGTNGISVDLMIYIDPINWSRKGLSYGDVPANVRQAYRFYTNDLFMHSRRHIAPLDPERTACTNLKLATPWFLWPIPLARHLSAPSRVTDLIPELIARAMNGNLDSIRFTKEVGKDESGKPVYEVAKTSGWVLVPADGREPAALSVLAR